jgi:hypothetical protein
MNKEESTVVVESVAASASRCGASGLSSLLLRMADRGRLNGVAGSVCPLSLSCMSSIAHVVIRHAPLRSPLEVANE